jgi:hypothetical protein
LRTVRLHCVDGPGRRRPSSSCRPAQCWKHLHGFGPGGKRLETPQPSLSTQGFGKSGSATVQDTSTVARHSSAEQSRSGIFGSRGTNEPLLPEERSIVVADPRRDRPAPSGCRCNQQSVDGWRRRNLRQLPMHGRTIRHFDQDSVDGVFRSCRAHVQFSGCAHRCRR